MLGAELCSQGSRHGCSHCIRSPPAHPALPVCCDQVWVGADITLARLPVEIDAVGIVLRWLQIEV